MANFSLLGKLILFPVIKKKISVAFLQNHLMEIVIFYFKSYLIISNATTPCQKELKKKTKNKTKQKKNKRKTILKNIVSFTFLTWIWKDIYSKWKWGYHLVIGTVHSSSVKVQFNDNFEKGKWYHVGLIYTTIIISLENSL